MARIVTMNVIPASAARNLNMYATIYGESSQTVTEQGKNLFDIGTTSDYMFPIQTIPDFSVNGNVVSGTVLPTGDGGAINKKKIAVQSGQTFSLSGVFSAEVRLLVRCLDSSDTVLTTGLSSGAYNAYYSAFWFGSSPATFSITSETVKYIQVGFAIMGSLYVGTTQTVSDIQLELGSTATEYEPFVPNSPSPDYPSYPTYIDKVTDFRGTEYALPQPLYSLPDGTKDVYDFLTGAGTANIGVNVLDGTEAWGYGGGYFGAANTVSCDVNNRDKSLCSHCLFEMNPNAEYMCFWIDSTGKNIRLRMPTLTDVISLKAYLAAQYAAGTPVTVVYKKATPTTITGTPVDFPELPYYAIGGGNKKVGISVK